MSQVRGLHPRLHINGPLDRRQNIKLNRLQYIVMRCHMHINILIPPQTCYEYFFSFARIFSVVAALTPAVDFRTLHALQFEDTLGELHAGILCGFDDRHHS